MDAAQLPFSHRPLMLRAKQHFTPGHTAPACAAPLAASTLAGSALALVLFVNPSTLLCRIVADIGHGSPFQIADILRAARNGCGYICGYGEKSVKDKLIRNSSLWCQFGSGLGHHIPFFDPFQTRPFTSANHPKKPRKPHNHAPCGGFTFLLSSLVGLYHT